MSASEDPGPVAEDTECPECGETFVSERGLRSHRSQVHKDEEGDTECPTCGRDDFASHAGMKCHHAKVHGESIAGKQVQCHYCGNTFRKETNLHTKRNFCSSSNCYEKWNDENKRVIVECSYCGDELVRQKSATEYHDDHFCTDSGCQAKWRSDTIVGENHPTYNKITIECTYCGDEFKRAPSQVLEKQFCPDSDCYGKWCSEYRTGENHPLWNGGQHPIRNLRRFGPTGISWLIARRRNREDKCQIEGCDATECTDGRSLHVHHLIPIRSGGTNEDWNLTTLCDNCHPDIESKTQKIIEPHLIPEEHR